MLCSCTAHEYGSDGYGLIAPGRRQTCMGIDPAPPSRTAGVGRGIGRVLDWQQAAALHPDAIRALKFYYSDGSDIEAASAVVTSAGALLAALTLRSYLAAKASKSTAMRIAKDDTPRTTGPSPKQIWRNPTCGLGRNGVTALISPGDHSRHRAVQEPGQTVLCGDRRQGLPARSRATGRRASTELWFHLVQGHAHGEERT